MRGQTRRDGTARRDRAHEAGGGRVGAVAREDGDLRPVQELLLGGLVAGGQERDLAGDLGRGAGRWLRVRGRS